MATKRISLQQIRFDGGTQMRAGLDGDTVADYREAYSSGVDMPPLVVFFDGSDYWLGDGFHRWHALHGNQIDKAECDVRKGSQRDAAWYACGANQGHGLRRTNEDKHRAVSYVLNDPEWSRMSDRQIAEHVGVSNVFVSKIRSQLLTVNSCDKRIGADGKARKLPERVSPAVPQHVISTPKESDQVVSRIFGGLGPSEPAATRRQCPNCGGETFGEDEDGEFCTQCKEPLDARPEPAKPQPAKSTQGPPDNPKDTRRRFRALWVFCDYRARVLIRALANEWPLEGDVD